MSVAFEITEDDIEVATKTSEPAVVKYLDMYKLTPSKLMGRLNMAKIEKAALRGDDIDEQTNLAHEEIRRQVKDLWVNPPTRKRR